MNVIIEYDERALTEKISEESEKHVHKYLEEKVDSLIDKAFKEFEYGYSKWGYARTDIEKAKAIKKSIDSKVSDSVSNLIEEHKNYIIEKAIDKLADRLSRTQKCRGMLDDLITKIEKAEK